MKLGEVYYWETEQVEGRDKRWKRQIYICRDEDDLNLFLFINKADWYKDHRILQTKYSAFLEYDSFIGCSSVARYDDDYLKALALKARGEIDAQELQALRNSIIAANTMVARDMKLVCGTLAVIA